MNKLLFWRLRTRMTQKTFAKAIGTHANVISGAERDVYPLRDHFVLPLADLLIKKGVGVTLSDVAAWHAESVLARKDRNKINPRDSGQMDFNALRKKLCMTQVQMAEALGVTQGHISALHHGRKLSEHLLARLQTLAAARQVVLTAEEWAALHVHSAQTPTVPRELYDDVCRQLAEAQAQIAQLQQKG